MKILLVLFACLMLTGCITTAGSTRHIRLDNNATYTDSHRTVINAQGATITITPTLAPELQADVTP